MRLELKKDVPARNTGTLLLLLYDFQLGNVSTPKANYHK